MSRENDLPDGCRTGGQYLQPAGVCLRPAHAFRRSCATELVRGNANLYHVSRMLGHESLDTLQHYAKLDVTDLRRTHHRTHPRERDEEARGA